MCQADAQDVVRKQKKLTNTFTGKIMLDALLKKKKALVKKRDALQTQIDLIDSEITELEANV